MGYDQKSGPGDSGDHVQSGVPDHRRKQTMIRDSDQGEQRSENAGAQAAALALIDMSDTKHGRRKDHHQPGGKTGPEESGHHKAAEEKLLANTGSKRQQHEQGGFGRGAREQTRAEDAETLQIRMIGAAHAADIGPVRDADQEGPDEGHGENGNTGRASDRQFMPGEATGERAPADDKSEQPLKENGG